MVSFLCINLWIYFGSFGFPMGWTTMSTLGNFQGNFTHGNCVQKRWAEKIHPPRKQVNTRWNTCFNHGGKNQTPWSLNKTTSQGELAPNYPGAGGLLSSMTRLCWAGLSIGPMQHLNEALLVEVSVAILMQHSLQIVTPKKCWWTGDFEILC